MYILIKLICFAGANRWYGIVEFDNKSLEQLQSIQSELDWRDINGIKVHCDFISPKLTCYSELNSKCLLVDNLPLDYCDISGFREIFSCHTRPLYCSVSKAVSWNVQKYLDRTRVLLTKVFKSRCWEPHGHYLYAHLSQVDYTNRCEWWCVPCRNQSESVEKCTSPFIVLCRGLKWNVIMFSKAT